MARTAPSVPIVRERERPGKVFDSMNDPSNVREQIAHYEKTAAKFDSSVWSLGNRDNRNARNPGNPRDRGNPRGAGGRRRSGNRQRDPPQKPRRRDRS